MKSANFIYNMHYLLWLKGKLIPIGYVVVMTICIAVPLHLGHSIYTVSQKTGHAPPCQISPLSVQRVAHAGQKTRKIGP